MDIEKILMDFFTIFIEIKKKSVHIKKKCDDFKKKLMDFFSELMDFVLILIGLRFKSLRDRPVFRMHDECNVKINSRSSFFLKTE